MSALELHRRVIAAMEADSVGLANQMINIRPRPTTLAPDGSVMSPASTAEEVGIRAIEIAAEIRAMARAIEVVNKTYAQLTQASGPQSRQKRTGGTYK